MVEEGQRPGGKAGNESCFNTTHWSVVLAATRPGSPQAATALEALCRTYWYPIYAYLRRQGHPPDVAEDFTQEYFARLLTRNHLSVVQPERGRFRSFLLASLRNFLVDQHRHASAAKRAGGRFAISLEQARAEERFRLEPAHELTPEKLYEREWARTLLDRARSCLCEEYAAAGMANLYQALQDFPLAGKSERSFQQAAAELGMTVPALKSAVHRLRARYRELVREEVAHTVADPAELKEEVRHLIAVLSD